MEKKSNLLLEVLNGMPDKKFKAMKRCWKKLHKMDRQFFRIIGAFTLLYLLLLPVSLAFLFNLVWMISFIILQYFSISIRRNRQYVYWLKGCVHQSDADWKRHRRTMYENAELKFKYDRLNSDYKKLEYDYNQLKKSINPIKKKKK